MIVRDPALVARRHRLILLRLPLVFSAALFSVWFIFAYFFRAAMVISGSMEPTISVGDTIVTWLGGFSGSPSFDQGDVVVISRNEGPPVVKRIIAMGGDRVAITEGIPVINGSPVSREDLGTRIEPWVNRGRSAGSPICANRPVRTGDPCVRNLLLEKLPYIQGYEILEASPNQFSNMPEITIPPGHLFLLGDNRDDSLDSRASLSVGGLGLVPEDTVQGRVVFRFRMPDWEIVNRPIGTDQPSF